MSYMESKHQPTTRYLGKKTHVYKHYVFNLLEERQGEQCKVDNQQLVASRSCLGLREHEEQGLVGVEIRDLWSQDYRCQSQSKVLSNIFQVGRWSGIHPEGSGGADRGLQLSRRMPDHGRAAKHSGYLGFMLATIQGLVRLSKEGKTACSIITVVSGCITLFKFKEMLRHFGSLSNFANLLQEATCCNFLKFK